MDRFTRADIPQLNTPLTTGALVGWHFLRWESRESCRAPHRRPADRLAPLHFLLQPVVHPLCRFSRRAWGCELSEGPVVRVVCVTQKAAALRPAIISLMAAKSASVNPDLQRRTPPGFPSAFRNPFLIGHGDRQARPRRVTGKPKSSTSPCVPWTTAGGASSPENPAGTDYCRSRGRDFQEVDRSVLHMLPHPGPDFRS